MTRKLEKVQSALLAELQRLQERETQELYEDALRALVKARSDYLYASFSFQELVQCYGRDLVTLVQKVIEDHEELRKDKAISLRIRPYAVDSIAAAEGVCAAAVWNRLLDGLKLPIPETQEADDVDDTELVDSLTEYTKEWKPVNGSTYAFARIGDENILDVEDEL
jgi:hypothetical protein